MSSEKFQDLLTSTKMMLLMRGLMHSHNVGSFKPCLDAVYKNDHAGN